MFKPATQDVVEIAQRIVTKWHPHLQEARIGFLFREKAPVSKGMVTLGQAKLVSPEMRAAGLDYDFLIWIAKDHWGTLDADQRIALLDHELCHCAYDEDEGKASMRRHDFEEFTQIVERHGFWRPNSYPMVQAVQMHLLKMEPEGKTKNVRGVIEAVAQELMKVPGVSVEFAE